MSFLFAVHCKVVYCKLNQWRSQVYHYQKLPRLGSSVAMLPVLAMHQYPITVLKDVSANITVLFYGVVLLTLQKCNLSVITSSLCHEWTCIRQKTEL